MINSILNKINYAQALKPVNFNKFAAKNISFGAEEDTFVGQNAGKLPFKKDSSGNLLEQDIYNGQGVKLGHLTVRRNENNKVISTEERYLILDKNAKCIGSTAITKNAGGEITSISKRIEKYNSDDKYLEEKFVKKRYKDGKPISTKEISDIYNEQGVYLQRIQRNTTIKDGKGNLIYKEEFNKVCSKNGREIGFNQTTRKYKNGQLVSEEEYRNNYKTGQTTTIKDGNGNIISTTESQFVRNNHGLLIGDNRITKDGDGNIVSTTEWQVVHNQYGDSIGANGITKDGKGNVLSKEAKKNIYDEEGINIGENKTLKEYAENKLVKTTVDNSLNGKKEIEFQYNDKKGRLSSTTTKMPDGRIKVAEFSYAKDGKIDSMLMAEYADGKQLRETSVKFIEKLGRRAVAVVKRTIPKA